MIDRYDEHLILAYVENELDGPARLQFETLMAKDEPLRQLVLQLIRDRDHLRAMPDHDAPAELMAEIHEALERHMLLDAPARDVRLANDINPFRFPRWTRWAAMAAAVALAAGLTWHFDPFAWKAGNQGVELVTNHGKGNPDHNALANGKTSNQGDGTADIRDSSKDPLDGLGGGSPSTDAERRKAGDNAANSVAIAGAGTTDKKSDDSKQSSTLTKADPAGAKAAAQAATSAPLTGARSGVTDPVAEAQQALALNHRSEQLRAMAPAGKGAAALGQLMKAAEIDDTRIRALQLEMRLASPVAASTQDVVLAWAKDHGAQAISADQGRSLRANALGSTLRKSAADYAADKPTSNQSAKTVEKATSDDAFAAAKPEAAPGAAAGSVPGAAASRPAAVLAPAPAPALTKGTADAKGAAPANDVPGKTKLADSDTGKPPAAPDPQKPADDESQNKDVHKKLSPPALANADGTGAARGALPGVEANRSAAAGGRADLAPAGKAKRFRKEVTLLVPADRVEALVNLIEEKTGQTLVVIGEAGAARLVEPQAARRRQADRLASESAKFGAPSGIDAGGGGIGGTDKVEAGPAKKTEKERNGNEGATAPAPTAPQPKPDAIATAAPPPAPSAPVTPPTTATPAAAELSEGPETATKKDTAESRVVVTIILEEADEPANETPKE